MADVRAARTQEKVGHFGRDDREEVTARKRRSFEMYEDDFGGGAYAEGRAPGAGAAGGVDQEITEALEAVGVGAEDARSEPGEGEYLAAVGVAGELE